MADEPKPEQKATEQLPDPRQTAAPRDEQKSLDPRKDAEPRNLMEGDQGWHQRK